MSIENNIKGAEERRFVRHNCEANIEWSYFNTGIYFDGKVLNFSNGGVYIETVHNITAGATIVIRLGKISSRSGDSVGREHPRLVSLGEVAWQTKFSGRKSDYFGAGIRYPVIV